MVIRILPSFKMFFLSCRQFVCAVSFVDIEMSTIRNTSLAMLNTSTLAIICSGMSKYSVYYKMYDQHTSRYNLAHSMYKVNNYPFFHWNRISMLSQKTCVSIFQHISKLIKNIQLHKHTGQAQ